MRTPAFHVANNECSFTFGSLFSGIGGLDVGLERAGMRCAWQVEIDDYAIHILTKHWPNVARFRDVRTVGAVMLSPVDVVCGGFPCQDISISNTRNPQGIAGARSGLWAEFFRLICQLRPRYVVVENVPALLGRGMGRVLGDLAAIGYDAEWQLLRASDFGAPHQRKRLFIIAYPHQERRTPVLRGDAALCQSLYPLWQTPEPVDDVWGRLAQLEARLGEPSVRGSYDGVPRHLERQLGGYGNAVVPQIAEYIGRCILAADAEGA